MLERAKGCFEQGRRQLLRFPQDQVKARRLCSGFWSHGAGQVDLSTYWLALLTPAPCQADSRNAATRRARRNLVAGVHSDGLLDFLYPAKARELLHKFAARDALRRKNILQRPKSATGSRLYSKKQLSTAGEEYMTARKVDRILPNDQGDVSHTDNPTLRKREKEMEKNEDDFLVSWKPQGDISKINGNPRRAQNEQDELLHRIAGYDEDFVSLRRNYHFLNARFEDAMRQTERKRAKPGTEREALTSALRQADELCSLGSRLVGRTAGYVSSYLKQNKEVNDWTEADWRIQMHALAHLPNWEDEYGQILERALALGKASVVIPSLTAALANGDVTWKDEGAKFWRYHEIYERWRNLLEDDVRSNFAPFWDYLIENKDVETVQLIEKVHILVKDEIPGRHTPFESHFIHSIRDLLKAVIRRSDFGDVSENHLRTFYLRLQGVLLFNSDYQTLHEFFKCAIFLDSLKSRLMHGEQAFKIFRTMNRSGGYQGETDGGPDLARKLFWRLCNMNMLTEALVVFENIRLRGKDWAMEYSILSFKLSQTGLREEWENLQVKYEQFTKRWSENRVGHRSKLDVYHDRIDLHRRRNELWECVNVFKELIANTEVEPDIQTYNLIISAHVRADDLDGAQEWFTKLLLAGFDPDFHSYVPFLKTFAYRGDVDRVRAITKEIEDRKIVADDVVVQSHLIALLQAGALHDAESLVLRSANFLVDDRTKLWDLLIGAFALRGDRKKVNNLLWAMRRFGIPPSSVTYGYRLRLWCARRQPIKAEQVIRRIMKPAGIRPTAFHYAIIMKGYNDMQNPLQAVRIFDKMIMSNVKPDWSVKQMLSRALVKIKGQRSELGIPKEKWRNYERIATKISPSDLATGGSILTVATDRVDELYPSAYFHLTVSLSYGSSDVDRAKNAWDAFMDLMKERRKVAPDFLPPISVTNRLLSAYRRHRMWNRVDRCWEMILKKAEVLGKPMEGDQIVYSRRFILCQPLYSYMRALMRQDLFSAKLQSIIVPLLKKGFRLDSRCWNQYVRGIVMEGPQKSLLAFETAEATIMSGWQGWPRIDHRAEEGSRRSLRQKMLFYAGWHSRKRTQAAILPAHLMSAVLTEPTGTIEGNKEHVARSKSAGPYAVSDADLGLDDGAYDKQSETQINRLERPEPQGGISNRETNSEPEAVDSSVLKNDTELVLFEEQHGPEGYRIRRPDYSTLVYLTRAFLDIRMSAAYEDKARDTIRQLSQVAPTVIQAILTMPRIDDDLQLSMLRR